MSASPSHTSNPAKRPLEDASSPSGKNDQPDAKRPALDKVIKNGHDEEDEKLDLEERPATPTAETDGPLKSEDTNGEKSEEAESKDDLGETTASEANESKAAGNATTAGTTTASIPPSTNTHDETAWIHIRAVISSPEAATIIGKGGENVSNIRKQYVQAFGLIIRTLNNEPLTESSTAQSKTYPLRLLIPHVLIGSIIGKGGVRIREIQEASGARLNASDSCLPLSTERSLVVMGVADAVHIATYYVGSTLLEQLNERFGGPAASAYATRSGGPAGVVPGGMQVVPYCPQPAGGNFGQRENYGRRPDPRSHHYLPPNPYPQQQPPYHGAVPQPAASAPLHYAPQAAGGYGAGPHMPPQHGGHVAAPQAHGGPQGQQPMHGGAGMAGAPLTQQIYIPNDMVGAIIGKGGQKINEIRQISGSVIKINEPQDNSNERLVTITGTEECNRMALYMLYSRLESEKHRI